MDLDGRVTPTGIIPSDVEGRIVMLHRQGAGMLRDAGVTKIESVFVPLSVESHRWAWRPDPIRVVLIAESHVYTSLDDLNRRVRRDSLPPDLSHLPDPFVRFVYGLGYGEPSLLSPSLEKDNSGTRDYWLIFGRLAGTLVDGAWPQPRGHRLAIADRITWKIATLRALRERGVWLLDSSLHAIYLSRGERVPPEASQALHALWWEGYGKALLDEIRDEKPDVSIWVVGGILRSTLASLGVPMAGWIYQPRAARGGRRVDMSTGWAALQAITGSA